MSMDSFYNQSPDPEKKSLFRKAKQELSRLRKTILRQLTNSKISGKFIAVSAEALGEGKIISRVEDIYSDGNEEIVVLKWYDPNGHSTSQTHLSLDEIQSVFPVNKMSKNLLSGSY